MDFIKFKSAVAKQFAMMSKHQLFRTKAEKDKLWETYLGSFPAGTDPIYRERTEHDCNCCKQFIRAVGNVVAVIDNKLVSIWDAQCNDETYQVVSDALSALVKSKPIDNVFLHTERTAGTDKNFEQKVDGVTTWTHFFVNIPLEYVTSGTNIGPKMSESQALHDVLLRSLNEITDDSIDTVLELIQQNSLYRGEEHKFVVSEFKKLKKQASKLSVAEKDNFVWVNISKIPASVSKIRNTSIGTLLTDLSNDVDMEVAVKSFESMVAPANYKRPTALVTKKMVDNAKKKIEELGLTSALDRRYATISDITINNILFANREAKKNMNADVFDDIAVSSTKKQNFDKVEEISIEKFISDIMPTASSIEVMFENSHVNNLVSLVAPVDSTAGNMFKWDNKFSWSYNGEMADSIKERVKKAGGNVTGDLCCRLAWFNHDDLDFHMYEPGGYEIYFGNRRNKSPCGGILDVDMNAGYGTTRTPVENIFYENKSTMRDGVYKLVVHNYSKRESVDVGFEVELDFMGDVHRFVYDQAVRSGANITVAEFRYTKKTGIEFIKSLKGTSSTKSVEAWNLQTNNFYPVNVMMLSPNHWDGHGVGNKHYFFMIDQCKNDGTARGFFNEFLKEELNAHRKVIEIVGSKMKTAESNDQLSGLGFSSTQRNHVMCRVTGKFTRVLKVLF